MIPENYSYNVNDVADGNYMNNCSTNTSLRVTTCQSPSKWTDFNTGAIISSADYSVLRSYSSSKILFTFHSETLLTSIILYYYTAGSVYVLPAMRVYAVPDDYDLESDLYNYTILHIVSPKDGGSGCRTIESITIASPTNTTKVLLDVGMMLGYYSFALSEVMFFTDNGEPYTYPKLNYWLTSITGLLIIGFK